MIDLKTLLRSATALALVAGVAMPAAADDSAPSDQIVVTAHAAIGDFGLDLQGDPNVRPGDDFERYVSGKWLDTKQIPGDQSWTGYVPDLREQVNKQLQDLIAQAPAGTQYGALYHAIMDEKAEEPAEHK